MQTQCEKNNHCKVSNSFPHTEKKHASNAFKFHIDKKPKHFNKTKILFAI
jgi:hypothetical protein